MKRNLNQNKPGSETFKRDYSRVEVYDDHVYKKIIPSRDRAVPLTKEWFKTYNSLAKRNPYLPMLLELVSSTEFIMERVHIITTVDKFFKYDDYKKYSPHNDINFLLKIVQMFTFCFNQSLEFSKSLHEQKERQGNKHIDTNKFFTHQDMGLYNIVITKDENLMLLDPDSYRFTHGERTFSKYFTHHVTLMGNILRKFHGY